MVIIEENDEQSESIINIDKPYQNTIDNLKEIQWIQCPVTKLNYIYTCLKFDLAEEIDNFYG